MGLRCRHLTIDELRDETTLVLYMAILDRLSNLTALTVNEPLNRRQFVGLLGVAGRRGRLTSLTLDSLSSDEGDEGDIDTFGFAQIRLHHLTMRDASADHLRALLVDVRLVRSIVLMSVDLDVPAAQGIIDSADRLRELTLVHYGNEALETAPLAGRRLLARHASRLVRLSVRGLGAGCLEAVVADLTQVVVLDAPFDAVEPDTWLRAALPQLRVLHIAAPDDTSHRDFDATTMLAGAIGAKTWPALKRLYHSPVVIVFGSGDSYVAGPAERRSAASLEVRCPHVRTLRLISVR